MAKLKATNNFSGILGSAGLGQVFEVDDATAEVMIKDGYPVVEVKANGRGAESSDRGADGDEGINASDGDNS